MYGGMIPAIALRCWETYTFFDRHTWLLLRSAGTPGTRNVGHMRHVGHKFRPYAPRPTIFPGSGNENPRISGNFRTSKTYVAVTRGDYESPALTVELRSQDTLMSIRPGPAGIK